MNSASTGLYIGSTLIPLPLLLIGATVFGALLTAVINRLVYDRKGRDDIHQKRFETSTELLAEQSDRRNDFTAAVAKCLRKDRPSIDDINAVMKTGEAYFENLRAMAQAVLANRVSETTRNYDFVPKIVEALEKSIPAYYDALTKTCRKVGIEFEGEFKEDAYEGLFRVADMYDHAAGVRIREKLAGPSA